MSVKCKSLVGCVIKSLLIYFTHLLIGAFTVNYVSTSAFKLKDDAIIDYFVFYEIIKDPTHLSTGSVVTFIIDVISLLLTTF